LFDCPPIVEVHLVAASIKMSVVLSQDAITRLVKFLETHNGRDKVVRTIQYFSRFFAWYLLVNNKPEGHKIIAGLEAHSSMSRKIFRLLKSVAFVQSASKVAVEETDAVVKVTTVVQHLALAVWLIYDHIIWATKLGLMQSDVAKHNKKANISWLISMIAGALKSAYLLQQTQQKINAEQKPDALDSLRKRQFEYFIELMRNVFDLPIPIHALNKTVQQHVPTGLIGLSGTFTSLIGIYQIWVKTK